MESSLTARSVDITLYHSISSFDRSTPVSPVVLAKHNPLPTIGWTNQHILHNLYLAGCYR